MMSSQSMQTFSDPGFRNKMPLFDGTMASAGLPKPQNMSDFLGKQTLQYSGAYFAYDPRAKDGTGFTSPWSNSKASLLDARSPVTHLPGMDGQNRITCRQESKSSEESHSHSSPLCHTQVKQGFALYATSPSVSSPTAATTVAMRKQKSGGENLSPPENPVYLAVPKPVYGHNPCCNELGCVMGRRYRVEHGSPRIPHTVYEHDWMQANAHYAERPPISRKLQDPLLQQRGLQYEHSAEPIKRMTVDTYSPSRARSFPAMIDPNYSSYPCTSNHTFFGSLSEQRQRLQTPPKGYPRLYPPHPTYEHMTSEVYQECSPMSKYGQLPQHPVFYYPQANVEVENRTQCKDLGSKQREDVPVILKHTISNPREHFIVPQSLHGEMPFPLPSAETLPNHSFIRAFDYPCYTIPRFHFTTSQISPPLKTQNALPSFHSNPINTSPSSQHMDHLMASAASLHKDKSNTNLHMDKSHEAAPLLYVEPTSSTRHISQSGISPSIIQVNRFFPLTRLHVDQPIPPPANGNIDRLMDYNHCEAQNTCSKLPASQAAWLPRSPTQSSDRVHTAATKSAKVRKIIYSPASVNKPDESATSTGTTLPKQCLKRSTCHSSPPIKIKEEEKDVCEVENVKKRRKVETDNVRVGHKTDSPPMPVIDNVFSLAPYQTYLQESGVAFPGGAVSRAAPSPEQHEVKTKSDIKETSQDQDEQQPDESLVPKESCPDIPAEEPAVEVFEPKILKVEKVEPSDTEVTETPRDQNDCSKIIKKELEQSCSSDSEPTFVIKTCEPDEDDSKPLLPDEGSEELKPAELTAQTNLLCQDDVSTRQKQFVTVYPNSVIPPQPTETKLKFRNINPQCLKLSTYKIILPDAKTFSPILAQEKSTAQQVSEYVPQLELQMPVRKHFLELHHSLCKLVSKIVSGSSKQTLDTWLSQMKLTEPTSSSTKVQKVSCLLGVKAREAWLNQEMESALHEVMERLREYTVQERCPFPHVMRTGAVFIPMLVVKEQLFPMVQGSFIDQVLQEHKVELRPTTLSEEKILIQLHKRACSSRLRRLMSLKHLPDIYADVVNLFYYACVCKHLGLDTDDPGNREKHSEETFTCSPFTDIPASPDSPSELHPKDDETLPRFNGKRTKSRVKRSSRYMFLDNSLSDEEKTSGKEKIVNRGALNAGRKTNCGVSNFDQTATRGDHIVAEEDSSLIRYNNSWTCPLTLDELSPSDTETEEASNPRSVTQSSGSASSSGRSSSCSGMILKLRRMFSEGLKRKKACYQAVSNSETSTDVSLSQTSDGPGEVSHLRGVHRGTPKATHRWQRTGSFSHALRPLSSSSSKRKHRPLLKIKYCPYLSACHSAEHRRRWVLRSAVQTARRAMRFYYPDLVGKRIHHLYEEDDKSEVWYRGEVLRIHEAHSNPLKTIFEVRYDSEPEWRYYLELLIDYKKGWLKIED